MNTVGYGKSVEQGKGECGILGQGITPYVSKFHSTLLCFKAWHIWQGHTPPVLNRTQTNAKFST